MNKDDIEELLILILSILIFLFVMGSPFMGLSWYISGKQADTYNKVCKPVEPITTSDVFWSGNNFDITKCNMKIEVQKL